MVPETLEPSLQLASAVLSQLNMPPDDVQEAIQEFRRAHMGELQVQLFDFCSSHPKQQDPALHIVSPDSNLRSGGLGPCRDLCLLMH